MAKAIFGRPINAEQAGGAHISVNAITLHKGKVVLFERPGLPGGEKKQATCGSRGIIWIMARLQMPLQSAS